MKVVSSVVQTIAIIIILIGFGELSQLVRMHSETIIVQAHQIRILQQKLDALVDAQCEFNGWAGT